MGLWYTAILPYPLNYTILSFLFFLFLPDGNKWIPSINYFSWRYFVNTRFTVPMLAEHIRVFKTRRVIIGAIYTTLYKPQTDYDPPLGVVTGSGEVTFTLLHQVCKATPLPQCYFLKKWKHHFSLTSGSSKSIWSRNLWAESAISSL